MLKPRHLAITLREVACMQVISVNLGRIRETTWKNKVFTTAIFKEPVSGPVNVATLGLDGDSIRPTTAEY
jgi:MOSC domain-containing protein YiiM